ncbi:family S53 protease-like protein [Wolfiporia cocos MD-104 SS10]|uniref:tripeptidyl-peptidase II n=1 Tax=Wolfiporia cocos (strain MD-104) TaxID=742152 RepID=A0A2H3JNS3_WOLCO|nr:family S53 protease-like protein [Wolfiporia cocos MD-104 SS10]
MRALSGLAIISLASLAVCKPTARNMRVLGRRDSAPSGFTLKGAASPDSVLNLRIALAQSNPAGLEEALYDVSTPSSPNYGQYLTKEEAAQFIAPSTETVSVVNGWLAENDLNTTSLTPAGDWLGFKVTVAQANELFNADFNVYTAESTGKQTIRTLTYSIPAQLEGHLTVVYPTVTFPKTGLLKPVFSSVKARRSEDIRSRSDDVASSCADTITPSCLQSLYGIPTTAATDSSNKLGVSGYDDQYANKADLEQFLQEFRPDVSDTTSFSLETLDGGSNSQDRDDAGVEADLDIQYTVGIATGVPVVFISVGEDNSDGDLDGFLDQINYLLDQDSPPQTLTTSYGDYEPDIPEDLAYNLCNAYAQLGARGVSLLFASGDGGVSGVQSESCYDFVPEFPSGCPYITSVGGTTGVNPETGVYFSGGGFSNYWGTPSYQASDVASYISYFGNTYEGRWNKSGRGFPDVAAQAENFDIVYEGSVETVSGTSCASPTFASVIALLNDELLAAGKSPLGFLNPWLYSTAASALTDITSGDNPGCNTNGFTATTGWDPVTGLGTPNFDALRTAAGL